MWNLSLHLGVASSIFGRGLKINCRSGPHTMSESHPFFAYLHSSFFILLSWTLKAHFSFEMGWSLLAHFHLKWGWTLPAHFSFEMA
jgi:hypothetical protein